MILPINMLRRSVVESVASDGGAGYVKADMKGVMTLTIISFWGVVAVFMMCDVIILPLRSYTADSFHSRSRQTPHSIKVVQFIFEECDGKLTRVASFHLK